jgi:hypothetical protein
MFSTVFRCKRYCFLRGLNLDLNTGMRPLVPSKRQTHQTHTKNIGYTIFLFFPPLFNFNFLFDYWLKKIIIDNHKIKSVYLLKYIMTLEKINPGFIGQTHIYIANTLM